MSGNTLRDALSEAYSAQEAETQTVDTVDSTPVTQTTDVTQGETAQQTADRVRDEAGRFKAKESTEQAKTPVVPVDPLAPAPVERKPPASWKKDYWEAYNKLDPKLAEYINQREQQFASGVSTYKQEAERAKEIFDAIAPFQADLQQHGISTKDWIRQLGGAHQILVKGSPEQKLMAFNTLARDYGVPLDALLDPNVRQRFLTTQPAPPPQDVGKLVEEKMAQIQIQSDIERFAADPANVHFEVVKETMSRILQTGLASDLKSAYDKAVRMNDETWQAEQQRLAGDAEKQRRDAEVARVARARANAVSTKTATPSGVMTSGGKKDVRSLLEASVEQVMGSARV
jgi:hypothetical protein